MILKVGIRRGRRDSMVTNVELLFLDNSWYVSFDSFIFQIGSLIVSSQHAWVV